MFDDDDFNDTSETSFPLFSLAALKNSSQKCFNPPLLPAPESISLIPHNFPDLDVFPDFLEPFKKRRANKLVLHIPPPASESQVTIKDIIEDLRAGIPTEGELEMRKSRMKKMHEARARNRRLKKQLLETQNDPNEEIELPALEPMIPIETGINIGMSPLMLGGNSQDHGPKIIFKDGKPVLDMSSSLTKTKASAGKELIKVDKKPKKITSMSFRKRNHTEKWVPEETRKFYKAIEIFGCDFSLISKLFPTRNRTQIKAKFRKEEKESPERMDQAFRKHKFISKSSLMHRIGNLNKSIQNENIETKNNSTMIRKMSVSSVDSMDHRIMDEIQELFSTEFKAFNQPPTLDLKEKAPKTQELERLDFNFESQMSETKSVAAQEQTSECVGQDRDNLFEDFLKIPRYNTEQHSTGAVSLEHDVSSPRESSIYAEKEYLHVVSRKNLLFDLMNN